MSAQNDKSSVKTLQKIHDNIKDTLVRVKPKYHDASPAVRTALVDDLNQIARLAQSFSEQRPRSNRKWADLADSLDGEGVTLWNTSGAIRQGPEEDGAVVVAAMRHAAFRLIEAGLEQRPGIETSLHVLQTASKTGAALSAAGNNADAMSVLTCAAKFEETLRNTDDPQNVHLVAKSCATVVFLCCRMEAAWKEGNSGVAHYMLQKITDQDPERLALLPARDLELLAAKILDIGRSILKDSSQDAKAKGEADGAKAQEAVPWIQKAFAILEKLDDSASPGLPELKRSILRSLARAYFLAASHDPENLARAEAALHELITSIDGAEDHANSEFQELRWMRLAVLKRRHAGDAALFNGFKSIIENMRFTEASITDLFLELRTLAQSHTLLSSVHLHCLQHALRFGGDTVSAYVDRLLMSVIIHSSKDPDHSRAMRDVEQAFNLLTDAEFELSKLSSVACLTLLWQYGNRHYQSKRWAEAADWFLAGGHRVFRSMDTSSSKCFRKAALCRVEQREYATASAIIRRCPATEGATHYVIMLIAIQQGLEDEAVRALHDMVKAPDFERKMLLLVTQISHQADMKVLLLAVLEELRKTLRPRENIDSVVEAMTLIRCSIRIALGLLSQPAANRPVLIRTLIEYFVSAKELVKDAGTTHASPMVVKDLSWLWRTAYNTAVQGCSDWENAEDKVATLFELAAELIDVYTQTPMLEIGPDIWSLLIQASFAAVSARVFSMRRGVANGTMLETDGVRALLTSIECSRGKIGHVLSARNVPWEEHEAERHRAFLSTLRLFAVEMQCRLKDWKTLSTTLTEATQSAACTLTDLEAIADVLWFEKDCPVDVLAAALEAILHAALDKSSLAIEKFSRWLRAICTILLSRNTEGDRVTALGYLEQAVTVLDDESNDRDEVYPLDEREWLLSTSYNTGIECLHASSYDESKRWFESSLVICRFLPDGEQRAAKISETYARLLDRYQPQARG